MVSGQTCGQQRQQSGGGTSHRREQGEDQRNSSRRQLTLHWRERHCRDGSRRKDEQDATDDASYGPARGEQPDRRDYG
jgi:hypothetical protein